MRITWYGHACFRLETEKLSIVTDPYTPDRAGLERVTDEVDVVVMSSAILLTRLIRTLRCSQPLDSS